MKTLTTKEIAEIAGTSERIARQWAKDNNVNYAGKDRAKIYLWTEENLASFQARNKKGGKPKRGING